MAGIIHILGEASEAGHCYLPQSELIEQVIKQLATETHEPESEAIQKVVNQMTLSEQLIREKDNNSGELLCYKPSFFHTEQNLAAHIRNLLSYPINVDLERVQNWIDRFTESRGIELSPFQRTAVEMAACSRVMILTGGPGCGKTFTTHTIVSLWKAMGKSIALAAPTGRAAQRLSEMTGIAAKTIHRLLEYDPRTNSFKFDSDNPLPAKAIVVDEASMLDLFLAHSLIKAIPADAQLLLVGDIDQLPSVGPGQVLRDLITASLVPVVRLTEVFRQAATSSIIRCSELQTSRDKTANKAMHETTFSANKRGLKTTIIANETANIIFFPANKGFQTTLTANKP